MSSLERWSKSASHLPLYKCNNCSNSKWNKNNNLWYLVCVYDNPKKHKRKAFGMKLNISFPTPIIIGVALEILMLSQAPEKKFKGRYNQTNIIRNFKSWLTHMDSLTWDIQDWHTHRPIEEEHSLISENDLIGPWLIAPREWSTRRHLCYTFQWSTATMPQSFST